MSDKVYVGRKAREVKASPAFSEYTKVVIIVGDDEDGNQRVFEAGTDTGSTLEVTNPWGTQQMANDMLARIQGYAYKPISADSAILTPAAELGDGVTAGSEYSVLASQNVHFDTLHASDIEAPDSGELEHEMPEYLSAADRKIARRFNTITTSFTVRLGEIETEITDTAAGLSSRITQTSDSITAEITRATEAESTLSSRITQTESSISSEITRAIEAEGILSSSITQTAESLSSEITRATTAEGTLSSRITQAVDSIELSVSTGRGGTTFTLTGDGTTLSTQTLDLHVQSVNIDGTITADAVVSNISISSPNIYGGTFYNSNGTARLVVGTDLIFYGASTSGSSLFEVYDEIGSFSLKGYGTAFLTYNDVYDTVYPVGNWDFSAATVTGLTARFG